MEKAAEVEDHLFGKDSGKAEKAPVPRLVATVEQGQARYDVGIDDAGTGKLMVTPNVGHEKEMMPLLFSPKMYGTKDQPCYVPRFSRSVYSRNKRGTPPPFQPQIARDMAPKLLRDVTPTASPKDLLIRTALGLRK